MNKYKVVHVESGKDMGVFRGSELDALNEMALRGRGNWAQWMEETSHDFEPFSVQVVFPTIDVVVTRHAPLVQVLIERGVVSADTPVLAHVTDPCILNGKHVCGILPLHLAARCAYVTEVPMTVTQEDRVAMTHGDLSLERTRVCAGKPVTYTVTRVSPE